MLRLIIVATCISAVAACSAGAGPQPTGDEDLARGSTTAATPPPTSADITTSAPDAPDTTTATTATRATETTAPTGSIVEPASITIVDGHVVDASRDRRIPYRAFVPRAGDAPRCLPRVRTSSGRSIAGPRTTPG